ncbi:MAG: hypothetical protein CMJ23_13495 [Phycisphaerae bacterium]|nr:hypothetical protein [Phycisphaerae bacterium]
MAHDVSTDDETLIDHALQGEDRAWEILIAKYGQLVWSVGRSCGLSAADTDDLVQVVFGALVRSLGRIEQRDRLASWLITTAKREAWRLSEKNRRERATAPEDLPESVHPPEDEDDAFAKRQAVRTALSGIGNRCQELLQDLFGNLQVPSYDDVAARLGLNPNSVGPIRRRCLQDLMKELESVAPEFFSGSS